jgi:integrase
MTLGEACERYFALKVRNRTLAEDRRIATHLKASFGAATPLVEITADRIARYKAARLTVRRGDQALSAAAINRPLALLRHLLKLARRWKVISEMPEIDLEKEPQGRLRWLTPDEATRLLAACRTSKNDVLAGLVEFAIFTGLRRGEALGLTWERVDRSRGVVRLEMTKSGKRREVP